MNWSNQYYTPKAGQQPKLTGHHGPHGMPNGHDTLGVN